VSSDAKIKVKVETDTTSAQKGLDKAATSAESFGSRFKSTFAGVLSANLVQNAAAKVFQFGKQSVEAYENSERTAALYHDALSKIPGASDKTTKSLEAQAKALSKVTIYGAGSSKQALATLAAFGLNGNQLKTLLPLVQDYAAKTGQDLPSAAQSVGKALLGQGRALKGIGIDFKNAGSVGANYAQLVTGLKSKVGGLAEEMGGTSAGKMKIMQNQITGLKVALGKSLVPAILAVADALQPLLDYISQNTSWLVPLAAGIIAVAVAFKVLNAAMALLGLNPAALLILGIAAAIVALIAVVYLLWKNWDTVWAAVKGAVMVVWSWMLTAWNAVVSAFTTAWNAIANVAKSVWAWILNIIQVVWNWIKGNWPLLVGILFGPFGLAAAIIGKYWRQVLDVIQMVWRWIQSGWATVYSFLTTPFVRAVGVIRGVVDGIAAWVRGVPGAVGRAIAGVFEAIVGPFQRAWNFVKNNILNPLKGAWNTVAHTINAIHVSFKIPSNALTDALHLGGKGFDWRPPFHIPTLAKGGLLTRTGLVHAHAGEVISPAPSWATRNVRESGTTVNITVNVPATANPAETGRAVAGALRSYFRAGGRLEVPA
jgi:hypothetical protein